MSTAADTLARIIAHVESANNQYAVRFEPATYARLITLTPAEEALLERISAANKCNHETAKALFSMSFGIYQLMGETLYGQGWTLSVGAYFANPTAQTVSFLRLLDDEKLPLSWDAMKSDPGQLEYFARRYNGPEHPEEYVALMQKAAAVLGV